MSRALSVALLSHLASEASPTGAERSLALLAAGLVQRGHRALVVAPGPWALQPELDAAGVEVRIQHCRVLWMTSYDAIPPPRAAVKGVRYSLPMSGERELQRLLSRRAPDVVHVNCLPHVRGARAARLVKRLRARSARCSAVAIGECAFPNPPNALRWLMAPWRRSTALSSLASPRSSDFARSSESFRTIWSGRKVLGAFDVWFADVGAAELSWRKARSARKVPPTRTAVCAANLAAGANLLILCT